MIFEAVLLELLSIENVSAIDNELTLHGLTNNTPTRQTELLPLGEQQQSISIEHHIVHIATVGYRLADTTLTLVHGDGVVNTNVAACIEQFLNHNECRTLTHIIGLGFERESPHGNGFALEVFLAAEGLD